MRTRAFTMSQQAQRALAALSEPAARRDETPDANGAALSESRLEDRRERVHRVLRAFASTEVQGDGVDPLLGLLAAGG